MNTLHLFLIFAIISSNKVSSLQSVNCENCRDCCGFNCLSFDDSSGCIISNSTQLLHPRVLPASNCFHHLQECVSCPNEENVWRDSNPKKEVVLHVSGDCHQPTYGKVFWDHILRLSGSLVGPATLVGDCPLVIVSEGASIIDIEFECLSGTEAIIVESGKNVLLSNVSALHASVFRAAHVDGVELDGFVAKVSSSHRTIAAIGNGMGTFEIECESPGLIAVQRLQSSTATYSGPCDIIDVGNLLSAFGTLYETEFYNKNADEDVAGELIDTIFLWSWRAALALLLCFGLIHEDYSAVKDITRQYK